MSTPSKRAAAYIRTATEGPEGDEALDHQMAQIEAYAGRHGYEIVQTYREAGSGLKEDRPGLQALMADAREGQFDVVIMRDLSRLFRNFQLTRRYYARLRQDYGVRVLFVAENPDARGGDA